MSVKAAGILLAVNGPARGEGKVDFTKEIQPILQQNCIKCHGPEKQKGKLRLDSKEAAAKGGKDGPAFVAGNAEKKEIYPRLIPPQGEDDDMPKEGGPLTKPQTDLIPDWVKHSAGLLAAGRAKRNVHP